MWEIKNDHVQQTCKIITNQNPIYGLKFIQNVEMIQFCWDQTNHNVPDISVNLTHIEVDY